jgi:4-hydroxy-tetrahydrodipicolinate reductase
MGNLRVVVSGTGFMGREVLAAVARETDLEPVGVLEKFSDETEVAVPGIELARLPMSKDAGQLLAQTKPDVVIDFTNAEWTAELAPVAIDAGVALVVGTTGLSEAFLQDLAARCRSKGVGAVVAPNFAIGAVLMVHLAKLASRYFDFAEITEMHQEKKVDAPSGTAHFTAQQMRAARGRPFEHTMPEKETLPGARGAEYEGIAIHSQRMPGFVAHQEVTLGGLGQTLRIRHDSTGRESFIPGVLLATREVVKRKELIVGLDKLIEL